ncbi:MAG: archease [Waddliaceae bacterium]
MEEEITKEDERKRVFFAFEVNAPWPEHLPDGRTLSESDRHLTLAFLGDTHFPSLEHILSSFPTPPFKIGLTGQFNRCEFLPPKRPNVVSWHIDWFDQDHDLGVFQQQVIQWLQQHDFSVSQPKHRFLPHVTLARRPFHINQWRQAFHPLPVMISNIHLYESLGHLTYHPRWTYELKPPFEEIDHTADVAFRVRGENLQQLYNHALTALTFLSPSLLSYLPRENRPAHLDDIIIDLNALITEADSNEGVPLKAVSFHGEIMEEEDRTIFWEMIIDV